MVVALSHDFYQIIPHHFGVKRPVMIDHLLRVKDKIKMLECLSQIVEAQHLLVKHMVSLDLCLNKLQYELERMHPYDI